MRQGIDGFEGGSPLRLEAGRSRETIEKFSLVDINAVAQVRKRIDQSGIDELIGSIEVLQDGKLVGTDLHQDPTVAVFSELDAKRYLCEINNLWNTNHKISDLRSVSNDGEIKYVIVVAGHRRIEALGQIAQKHGAHISVHCVSYDGAAISFDRALEIQYNENFHKRPESHEDAAAISDIYRAGSSSGKYKTYADCARHLNIHEDRVSRARRFTALPNIVQELTREGLMSYTDALMASALYSAIAINHLSDDEDMANEKKKLIKQLRENKLHYSEVKKILNTQQKVKANADVDYYTEKLLDQKKGRRRTYIKEIVGGLLDVNDTVSIFNMLDSEQDSMQAETRSRDREMRIIAVQSLRSLVTVLHYFNQRQLAGAEDIPLRRSKGLIALALKGLGYKTIKDRNIAIAAAREAAERLGQEAEQKTLVNF